MSASLVGSEMCIRDSPRDECTPHSTQANTSVQKTSRTSRQAGSTTWTAVSYTHLTLPTICSV
eukprot:12068437-Alexandrium_andersonii.AAC.1